MAMIGDRAWMEKETRGAGGQSSSAGVSDKRHQEEPQPSPEG